jgi:enediyne biosynthesis protein E11
VTVTDQVLADLTAEGDQLDLLVAGLEPADWQTMTPAPGWTIAHQIGHLASTDRVSVLAMTDPAAFLRLRDEQIGDFDGATDADAAAQAAQPAEVLLALWREGRAQVTAALAAVPAGQRVSWMVQPVAPATLASTRLMELFAHGQDIRDALAIAPQSSARLQHVARFSVRSRDFAFALRGLPAPAKEFRVELTGPDGDLWAFGQQDAKQRVSGPALDFCLLVTRRRHRADLSLIATGPDADQWLDIAQAYVGPPSAGREPGQFKSA